uniref:Uncharacterized protein n=1 Tax=Anguilla anguilla TaxID=7936 RepID=A0A0E9S8C7_ANGAN
MSFSSQLKVFCGHPLRWFSVVYQVIYYC